VPDSEQELNSPHVTATDVASLELGRGTGLMGRPRIFVSSTIYDFHDLRSALKWWLEQMGCEVRMSEFTDFNRPPDQGALNSCFAAIQDSHFYVLLIGGRRGSWYDQDSLLSITRQEFRVAAELARQGKLIPVVFVRKDVVTALREWQSRAKRHRTMAVPLRRVGTKLLDDPAFTQAFIDEVDATDYGPTLATAAKDNVFRYEFTDFADLVSALRVNLHLQGSVRRQAMLANLRWELIENVSILCTKYRGMPQAVNNWVSSIRHSVILSKETVGESYQVTTRQASGIVLFSQFMPAPDRVRTAAIQEAIASGEFFQFDPQSGKLKGDDVYVGMQSLLVQFDLLRRRARFSAETEQRLADVAAAVQQNQPRISVDGGVLLELFALHDTTEDILRISIALLRHILNPEAPFKMPQLSPSTPLVDVVASLDAERAAHHDVEQWAIDGRLWGWVSDAESATDEVTARLDRYPWLKQLIDEEAQRIADELDRRIQTEGPERAMAWFNSRACGRADDD
jgi:hypothetical protein